VSAQLTGTAVCSDCGRYRYQLTRRWADGEQVVFVMLNPSTADAQATDPTLRRCVHFARAWGFGRLVVVNLFAWRSPRPADLAKTPDPVGPDNRSWVDRSLNHADAAVAAWGSRAKCGGALAERFFDQVEAIRHHNLNAIHLTKAGDPGHPLFVPRSAQARPIRRDGDRFRFVI
jgi:hypothetical protein